MIARENLPIRRLLRERVFRFRHLHIVLDDIRKLRLLQNVFPEIRRLEPARIWWIARAVMISLVEWQEP